MIKVGFVLVTHRRQRSKGVGFYAMRLLPKLKKYSKNLALRFLKLKIHFKFHSRSARTFSFQISNYSLSLFRSLLSHPADIQRNKNHRYHSRRHSLEFPDHYPTGNTRPAQSPTPKAGPEPHRRGDYRFPCFRKIHS